MLPLVAVVCTIGAVDSDGCDACPVVVGLKPGIVAWALAVVVDVCGWPIGGMASGLPPVTLFLAAPGADCMPSCDEAPGVTVDRVDVVD
jgi:hypothetical protein